MNLPVAITIPWPLSLVGGSADTLRGGWCAASGILFASAIACKFRFSGQRSMAFCGLFKGSVGPSLFVSFGWFKKKKKKRW